MKRSYLFIPLLLLSGAFSGCLENPLWDDDAYYDPPPPGPPNVSGSVEMTSATGVIGRGGTMTVYVKVSNAFDVEKAYDIQGEIYVDDGPTEIGSASIYLGDLKSGQWTDTYVAIPINMSKYPSSATKLTLYLTWWDVYDNMYQSQVGGYSLSRRRRNEGEGLE